MKKNIFWLDPKIIDDRIDSTVYIEQIKIGLFELLKKADNNIIIKTLDDICENIADGPFGSAILEKDYVAEGVPFIRVQNVTEYGLDSSNMIYINIEANNRIKRSECKSGDLVFTKTGRLGSTSVLTDEYKRYNIRGDLAKLVLKKNIDPHYLMSYLNSNIGSKISNSYSSGSTRGRILLSNIRKINVPIPSSEIQKYIGDKVRKAEELREEAKGLEKVCEDKIKKILKISENESLYNNNAGNKTTEYNKYPINLFIAVRDVKERLDANAYHPEYYETVERIKNSLIEYSKLDDMVESYGTGKSSPLYVSDGVPILMTKNIKNNCIDWNCKMVNSQELNRKDIVNMNEVLITTYGGPSIGKVDILYEDILTTFDYTILKMKFKEQFNAYFMTLLLRSKLIQNQIRYMIKGTTGITFVNSKEILSVLVPKVDKVEQDEIGNIYKNVLMKMKLSKQLIQEAKKDVEDLIEGNFDMSKLNQS